MNLVIEKRQDYIWKCYNFGHDYNMDFQTSWYVVDTDTNTVMDGGCHSGNNTKSGHVLNERKKDAKAWLDGFNAFMVDNSIITEERIERTSDDGHVYYNNMRYVLGNPFAKGYNDKESMQRAQYFDGVVQAAKYFKFEVPFVMMDKYFTLSDDSEI